MKPPGPGTLRKLIHLSGLKFQRRVQKRQFILPWRAKRCRSQWPVCPAPKQSFSVSRFHPTPRLLTVPITSWMFPSLFSLLGRDAQQKQLREGRVILAHSSGVYSPPWGEPRQQECGNCSQRSRYWEAEKWMLVPSSASSHSAQDSSLQSGPAHT